MVSINQEESRLRSAAAAKVSTAIFVAMRIAILALLVIPSPGNPSTSSRKIILDTSHRYATTSDPRGDCVYRFRMRPSSELHLPTPCEFGSSTNGSNRLDVSSSPTIPAGLGLTSSSAVFRPFNCVPPAGSHNATVRLFCRFFVQASVASSPSLLMSVKRARYNHKR